VRRALATIHTPDDLARVLRRLDPDLAFPLRALRLARGKDGRPQKRVQLPSGFLDDRNDDTPPVPPLSPAQLAAFERALDAG
jgi:hypothetical protein